MRVVVTRPQPDADRWVARLIARGIDAVALPLLHIGPAPDPQALARAAARTGEFDAVMFVSGPAARAFMAEPGTRPWPARARAWAPGPGTRDALAQAGIPAGQIDSPDAASEQFDSESLWAIVGPRVGPGFALLVVGGADAEGQASGRDWLAQRVAAAGGRAESVSAYVRDGATWSDAERAAARAPGQCWLLSSSQAVRHLAALVPGHDWSGSLALVTHPRIAQAARDAGFGRVVETRPELEAIIASIESTR